MKIAIITSRYPSEGNPYNHMFVHMRSIEFKKQLEEVVVFVPNKENREYFFEGITVKLMPSKYIVKMLKNYDMLYLHLLHMYPFLSIDGWPIYREIIKKRYLFAMYVHGSEFSYFKDRFFNSRYQLRDFLSRLRKDFYHMPNLKDFFSSTHKGVIITPSNWMKHQISNIINNDNIYVVPNGIDINLFSYHSINPGTRLITLRPLGDKLYDIESTIGVLSLLPAEYTLDIYGQGKYQDDYQKLIDAKGLSQRVRIMGQFIERREMNKLFASYNIFISTTRLDTQGVTMLEAMSSGLLVASIDNSSKSEFISDMQTGVLSDHPKGLAAKILEVNKDSELFEGITKKGRESMEKINLQVTCRKELKILKEIADNK